MLFDVVLVVCAVDVLTVDLDARERVLGNLWYQRVALLFFAAGVSLREGGSSSVVSGVVTIACSLFKVEVELSAGGDAWGGAKSKVGVDLMKGELDVCDACALSTAEGVSGLGTLDLGKSARVAVAC